MQPSVPYPQYLSSHCADSLSPLHQAAKSAAAEAEAARAASLADLLAELGDTPGPAPAIRSAKLGEATKPALSSRPSTGTAPPVRASSSVDKPSSSRSSDPAARPSASRPAEASARPSSSRTSDPAARASKPKPSSSASSTAPLTVRPSAVAGILASSSSPPIEQSQRVLSSTKAATATTATSKARPLVKDPSSSRSAKENGLPVGKETLRPLREGEKYKVF